jgi:hypothetical protein
MKLNIKDLSIESRQYVAAAIADCANRTGYLPTFGEVVNGILTGFRTMQLGSDFDISIFAAKSMQGDLKTMDANEFAALECDYMAVSAALAKRIVAEHPKVETTVRFLDKYAELQELQARHV